MGGRGAAGVILPARRPLTRACGATSPARGEVKRCSMPKRKPWMAGINPAMAGGGGRTTSASPAKAGVQGVQRGATRHESDAGSRITRHGFAVRGPGKRKRAATRNQRRYSAPPRPLLGNGAQFWIDLQGNTTSLSPSAAEIARRVRPAEVA
jgi:hypothetical protein